jgi:pimeloyl-ACP methyl ester carboxylesterase
MWGNHRTTWRHYRYLNDKGFDCVSFNLLLGSTPKKFSWHPDLRYFYKGVFYLWTRQIRSVLDHVEGEKIVYGFSGPSLSAFWACHNRGDILKVVCDGGPFHHVYGNTRNFFRYVVGIKQPWLNKLAAFVGAAIWGYRPLDKLHKVLRSWSPAIPILSIRGVQDEIVAINSIRQVFEPHGNLQVSTLELEAGRHLNGMRDFPEPYCKSLLTFLLKDLPQSPDLSHAKKEPE